MAHRYTPAIKKEKGPKRKAKEWASPIDLFDGVC